jgi:ABC-2 type transport system permease protein
VIELFLAELKRGWTQFLRYPMEALSGIFITTVVFYGLFLGTRYMAGPGFQFSDRLDAVIVGYVLWTLAIFILWEIAGTLQQEASTGTLEQLFLSPFGARRVFLTRAIADLTLQVVMLISILSLIMLLTGRQLSFPPTLVLPLATVMLAAYGLAFAIASLALIFKRIQQVFAILQFSLLFVMTIPMQATSPVEQLIGALLPMGTGAQLLRDLIAQGQPLDLRMLSLATLNGLIYFAGGLFLFRRALHQASSWLSGLLTSS